MMKKLHKVLLGSALLTLAGTACAEIAEDTTYGYKYTNTADIYSPGGAGTVGNQQYDMYIQNLALGKPASASSRYNPGMFGPEQAVDGIYDSAYSGVQNFFHAADENKAWWKINYAETAAGIDSVVIFDRAGYTYRLDDYQITVWDGDPDGGGNLVWSSDIFDTSNTPRKEYAVPENVAGTWLKITNQVPEENASTNALTLSEVMIIGGKESKTGVYGNLDGGWIAPTFTSAADSTLQIDMNFSAADPVYDVLDVAGQFTAGGTLALNLLDSANIANGVDYQIIKAGSYAGSFTKVNISALDSANVVVLMNKLNSEGKISFETGRIHWKETAADTNFANNANWSSAPANQSVLYGVYTGSPSTSRLASEMALDQLHMGYSAGASGTLEIGAGGKLTVASQLNIGVGGAGVLTVNGGELDFTRNGADVEGFLVGQNSGSNGTLNVIDGTVNTYGFTVGTNSGAAGTVNVSGGALNIRSGNNLRVGIHGVGTINVTGGTVTADCEVYMADQPAGSGTLSISGGMMTVNNGLSVGTRNAAVLDISGGSLAVNRLIVAYGAHGNSRGMVNQTGGTISVKDENGAVYFGSMEYGGTGVYNLSGGKLTAPSVKYGHTNTTAAFNISGTGEAVISGAVAVPTRLAGGTLTAGSITNTLTHSNGVFAPGGVGTYGTTAVTGTYISETGNLALGKPASQVNNYQNGVLYHAGDAVDGNMNTFSHTDPASGTNQWWQVMFSEHGNQSFDFVKVFNRGDDGWRLTEQGSGFHFELYSGTLEDPGEMIERSERFDSTSWSQGKELALNFEKEGNILRLVRDFPENFPLSGDNLTLNLSEVQILSNAAEIQMDLKSDASEFDKILIDGGSMDVSYTFLDLTIDDLVNVAPGTEWELFSTVNNGTLTGDFLAVSLNGMELTEGWEFADGILAFNGTRNQVPEPGTMVLLALGLGGLFLVRRKR